MKASSLSVRVRYGVSLAAFALGLAVVTPSAAQGSKEDVARADALFRDAQALMQKGQYGDACSKFAESQKLDPANGTLLNLALCHEKAGKTGTAYRELRDLVSTLSTSKSTDDRERIKVANERLRSLEKKLVRVTFDVSALPKDASLVLDGEQAIDDPGSLTIVDPGAHVVDVSAEQKKPSKKSFEAKDPGSTTVTIGALEDLAPPAPEAPPPETRDEEKPRASSSWTTQRIAGVVVAGVGVVGLGVGAIFGLDTFSKRDARDQHCRGTVCDAQGMQLHDQAASSATLSSIAFGAGVVCGVVGALLYFTSPQKAPAPAGTANAHGPTHVSVGPSGIAVGGAF